MTLKRLTDARPKESPLQRSSERGRTLSSRRALGSYRRFVRKDRPERTWVQILVVVANVQARALRTVVEKGFALTAIVRKSVGPKGFG